jgi:hypothetical protein
MFFHSQRNWRCNLNVALRLASRLSAKIISSWSRSLGTELLYTQQLTVSIPMRSSDTVG